MRRGFRCFEAKERMRHEEASGPCCGAVEARRRCLRGVTPWAPLARSKSNEVTMLRSDLTGSRSCHWITGCDGVACHERRCYDTPIL
ncbi:hypothetical protein NDU88_008045 [Pleurodeles waltl]|uniref:Uncharacterized protein n=1 Tax=Pleurodeles waltl TaxID=8319 RepID=A0AAV7NY27_PLEWA|nr:hypothetical protein NDU88_008045 [Pleurodeles waltl]